MAIAGLTLTDVEDQIHCCTKLQKIRTDEHIPLQPWVNLKSIVSRCTLAQMA